MYCYGTGELVMRVLVVDDLAINRVLTISLLRTLGVEAHGAGGASSALKALSETDYEAILVDYFLGDMTGAELARRVRAEHGQKHRIVGLSGDGDAATRQEALEAGMDAFLCKPATCEALKAVLKTDGPTLAGCV